MRSIIIIIIIVAATLAVPGIAQQSGDGDRNYRINGQGSGQASPSQVTVPNCVGCGGWSNEYFTGDPGAPVAWLIATQGQIGWFTTATNSVDIGPAGLGVLLDGTDPNDPLASAWSTDANGRFSLGLSLNPALHGSSAYFAMLHFAASSPDGFWLSQTHQTSFDATNTLGQSQYSPNSNIALALGDDDSALVDIGFTFMFYGTAYTQCYVNSNGSVTFGSGSTLVTESPANLASGPRRAAVWWDDLDPSAYGQVSYESVTSVLPPTSTFTVTWAGVPEYGSNGGSNDFSLTLRKFNGLLPGGSDDYDVIFDYGNFTSRDGLVGISPGGTIFGNPTPMALDLSAAPNALSASQGVCYYEQFEYGTNPADLSGQRVDFDLDGSGFPNSQL
jgi:hypothetical protein